MRQADTTIFALSSGSVPAGVAVIRLSGSQSRFAIETFLKQAYPSPRQSTLCNLYHPVDKSLLDQVILLSFPAPASFTGEDVVEIHCHGSRAVVAILLDCLSQIPGVRAAEPGEFSRRAFENGKLDLTAVEGLGDLIHADTEVQRRQAVVQMAGGLEKIYSTWRADIVRMRALIEADLDFADEEDVPSDVTDGLFDEIRNLSAEINRHITQGEIGERIRDGVRIALVGAPNVGKSSLLNALAKRDVAIVTDQPGTTRDVIEVQLDLRGYPVSVFDTAGLRETTDLVEQEGIRRSTVEAVRADLVVALTDHKGTSVDDELARLQTDAEIIKAQNKTDLIESAQKQKSDGSLLFSARTGEGLGDLIDELSERVARLCGDGKSESAVWTRQRHKSLLLEVRDALDMALASTDLGVELVAEHLRQAGDSLGKLVGVIDVDDLLDVIFREFCIGK
ncbi:tRNA uridine-5-carboxymethylaminomethyl(34) synthesis GTPase MnmE [Coralliovum pocilloporae]|uniref:tRNA uridine-5-carboxymethylaminomethyl(34) synthesis GTPase MnmE n=1 Tax=Coralliovum pocilloporae TaxID=3066369 RepID=UPI003307A9D1